MTREYLVVYEKGTNNWSAFSPDVPGFGSVGDDLEETRKKYARGDGSVHG